MQPRLHGPNRPVNDLRDLLVTPTLFVEQDEDLAVLPAERIHRGADFGPKFDRVISGSAIGCLVQILGELGTPATLAHPGATSIDGDPEDPRSQWAGRVPAPQATKDAQKDLLGHILSVVAVGEQALAHREDVGLQLLNQLTAGGRVTSQAAANERGVGGHDGPF